MRSMAIRPRRRPHPARASKQRFGLAGLIGAIVLLSGPAVLAAQAKDHAKPVGDARTAATVATGCEAFGPGFRKIDGLDTCVKVGGGVRVESGYIAGAGRAMSAGPVP